MVDIAELIKERGKTHGDVAESHGLIWDMWQVLLDSPNFNKLDKVTKVNMFMIQLKQARGTFNPTLGDHWVDTQGYAELQLIHGPKGA